MTHPGDGTRFGVRIRCVANDRPELQVPYSVYLSGGHLGAPAEAQRRASFAGAVWLMVNKPPEELGLVPRRAAVGAGSEPRARDASSVR